MPQKSNVRRRLKQRRTRRLAQWRAKQDPKAPVKKPSSADKSSS